MPNFLVPITEIITFSHAVTQVYLNYSFSDSIYSYNRQGIKHVCKIITHTLRSRLYPIVISFFFFSQSLFFEKSVQKNDSQTFTYTFFVVFFFFWLFDVHAEQVGFHFLSIHCQILSAHSPLYVCLSFSNAYKAFLLIRVSFHLEPSSLKVPSDDLIHRMAIRPIYRCVKNFFKNLLQKETVGDVDPFIRVWLFKCFEVCPDDKTCVNL